MNTKYTKYTKAQQVQQMYDDAQWEHINSDGCYSIAIAEALALGGKEIYNANDEQSSKSFAPTVEFEFDDASIAQIEYGGVFC